MTGLPNSYQGMDLWIECTKLGFKIKARLVKSVEQRKATFFCYINNISQIRSIIKRNLKKKDRKWKHFKYQSSHMKKDEGAVQDIEFYLEELTQNL